MTYAFSSAVACNICRDHYEDDNEEIFRNESSASQSSNAGLDRAADFSVAKKSPAVGSSESGGAAAGAWDSGSVRL